MSPICKANINAAKGEVKVMDKQIRRLPLLKMLAGLKGSRTLVSVITEWVPSPKVPLETFLEALDFQIRVSEEANGGQLVPWSVKRMDC